MAIPTNAVHNYPKPFVYGRARISGATGHPYTDVSVVTKASRYPLVILPVEPFSYAPYNVTRVLGELRIRNPKIKLFAYFQSTFLQPAADQYPSGQLLGDLMTQIKSITGTGLPDLFNNPTQDISKYPVIYDTSGTPVPWQLYGSYVFDYTRSDLCNMMITYLKRIYDSGLWDGIFLDEFADSRPSANDGTGPLGNLNQTLNFTKTAPSRPGGNVGYGSLAAFSADLLIGTTNVINAFRAYVPSTYPIILNYGTGSHEDKVSGQMRENFDQLNTQNAFSPWMDNMQNEGIGYLYKDRTLVRPTYNVIKATIAGTDFPSNYYDSASTTKFARYCICSSLLGDGYITAENLTTGHSEDDPVTNVGFDSWFDEYDNAGMGTGYLGQPTSIPYQFIDPIRIAAKAELFSNPGFETDADGATSITGWSTGVSGAGNTISVDASTFAPDGGAKSLKFHLPSAPSFLINAKVEQTIVSGGVGSIYSMTFWAKAAAPRAITINMKGSVDGKPGVTQSFYLDTTWRQFQCSGMSYTNAQNILISIYAGQYSGDVWVDGIQVRNCAGNVWARDFEHGTALVNPLKTQFPSTDWTITLPASYKKIKYTAGKYNSTDLTNFDGSTVSSIIVQTQDGMVLLSTLNPPISRNIMHSVCSV